MKKLAIRKTAGLMTLILSISLLLPIIGYAAAEFIEGKYDASSGRINAVFKVPTDVYAAEGLEGHTQLEVKVFTSNGGEPAVIYLTYITDPLARGYENGYYYYSIEDLEVPGVQGATSVHLDVYSPATNEVFTDVDLTKVNNTPSPGTGTIYVPPVTNDDNGAVEADQDGTVDADKLKEALKSGSATVEISGDQAKLPASALTEGGNVTIVSELGSYELPLGELNLETLAEELGGSTDEVVIVVTITEVKGDDKAAAEQAIESAGVKAVSPVIDFKVEAVYRDHSVEIKKFGQYVKRTVTLTGAANNPVAVRIEPNGDLSVVPATFGDDIAEIYSNTNSLYAIIDVPAKSFSDLVNHWAAKDIHTLANKLIVNGTGEDKFSPARDVTRAEFAAMIVRALGLKATGEASFGDVDSSAWYAGAVAAAADAGIVKGDASGNFRPNDKISRQEMAVMVIRAQELAVGAADLSSAEIAALLGGFKDADKIGGWAKAELAAAIDAGILKGTTDDTVSPNATASRAEAATMIARVLKNLGFI